MNLSFSCDNFIQNYIECNPSWMVVLNNGTTVYQDDGRFEPNSAWERLGIYCKQNGLYITDMQIRFRTNIKKLPSNKDGYFFCKMARGMFGGPKTLHLFLVGYLEDGLLNLTKWKVPEMLEETSEIRDPAGADICLIAKDII